MKATDGVITADASFITGHAVVTYDPRKTSPQALIEAINARTFYRASFPGPGDEGVAAESRQIRLRFQREFDPARTWRIATRLKELGGVTDVNALADGRISVTFNPERVGPKRIIGAIEAMGYEVAQVQGLPQSADAESGWSWSFVYGPLAGLLVLSALILAHRRRKRIARGPEASS